jgi:hypothetical protein
VRHRAAQDRGHDDLHHRTRHGDPPYGQQVIEGEMDADAEHEQDDADLGELLSQRRVGHEAGRVGARHDAGDEVAHQGRQAKAMCHHAEQEGEPDAASNGHDECGIVQHAVRSRTGETGRRVRQRPAKMPRLLPGR